MPEKMAEKNDGKVEIGKDKSIGAVSGEFGKSTQLKISVTQMHEKLNPFYAENGLEIAEDEPVSTDTIKSWVIMKNVGGADVQPDDAITASTDIIEEPLADDDAGENIVGACTLAFRQGEYIIDGIALAPQARGTGGGTALLKAAEEEAALRGGKRIYLVARAPEFFRENGYVTVERGDAPEFFECFGCDQYNKTCFPEVMKHVL